MSDKMLGKTDKVYFDLEGEGMLSGLNKHDKMLLILSILITVLVYTSMIALFYTITKKNYYTKDYYEELGIENYSTYTYNDMVNDFGKPKKVVVSENLSTLAIYDDITFSLWTDSEDSGIACVWIRTSKYRFGSKSIGIGSSKKEVEKAYKNVKKSIYNSKAYNDRGVHIQYFFNDEDLVYIIKIF